MKGKISEADSEISCTGVTSIPFFNLFNFIKSAHGSITTPFPRIETFFSTIPDGNNLNLNTFLSITKVCPALCPP